MAAERDNTFPSTSIGRTQGAHVSRTSSFESLSAHPLLAPAAATALGSTVTPAESQPAPKYVPYTPRHRVPSTSTTTGTTLDPSTSFFPPQYHGAASKLHFMSLKAAAQDVDLKTSSVGWAILEKIVCEGAHSTEWNEIWNSITTGKVCRWHTALVVAVDKSQRHLYCYHLRTCLCMTRLRRNS
jgi:hypothetical protein